MNRCGGVAGDVKCEIPKNQMTKERDNHLEHLELFVPIWYAGHLGKRGSRNAGAAEPAAAPCCFREFSHLRSESIRCGMAESTIHEKIRQKHALGL